jgi:hypothetical protein
MSFFGKIKNMVKQSVGVGSRNKFEDFTKHWEHTKNFFASEGKLSLLCYLPASCCRLTPPFVLDRDHVSLEDSGVVAHLNEMTKLLEREDAEAEVSGTLGPLLEYCLNERIPATLVEYAVKDNPHGIMGVVYRIFTRLNELRFRLLMNQVFYYPLCTLLTTYKMRVKLKASKFEYDKELVDLLYSLCQRLSEDTSLAELFFVKGTSKTAEGGSNSDFLVFTTLAPHLNDEGEVGNLAKKGLLYLTQITSREVAEFIVEDTSFVRDLVSHLRALWRQLPLQLPHFEDARVQQFLSFFAFVDAAARSSYAFIATEVAQTVKAEFFETDIKSFLLKTSEKAATRTTMYLRWMVSALESKLLADALCSILFSDLDLPETREESQDDTFVLRTTLIRRIDSMNEQLSLQTLLLFDELLSLHNHRILVNLVVRNMIPCKHIVEDPLPKKRLNDSFGFTLIFDNNPGALRNEEIASQQRYVEDAQQEAVVMMQELEMWMEARSENIVSDWTFYEGLFMEVLLNRLENMFDQSLECNIALTGLISRLALCPQPELHAFLLDRALPVADGVRTLPSVMADLVHRAQTRALRIPDFDRHLYRSKLDLEVYGGDVHVPTSGPGGEIATAQQRFVQACVILEEFRKELAAISQAADRFSSDPEMGSPAPNVEPVATVSAEEFLSSP